MADWIRRALEAQGTEVYHVKNITDVGHMRQELVETGRGQDDPRGVGGGQDHRGDCPVLRRQFSPGRSVG